MKAKYYKIYSTERKKEKGEEMGFVKEIYNSLFIIYKKGECRLLYLEKSNEYLELFNTKKCTKKEFKKAFDDIIDFYKKLV